MPKETSKERLLEARQTIGDNVRRLRSEQCMARRELAEHAGLGADYVSRLERGKCNPLVSTLTALSNALNVPITELIKGI